MCSTVWVNTVHKLLYIHEYMYVSPKECYCVSIWSVLKCLVLWWRTIFCNTWLLYTAVKPFSSDLQWCTTYWLVLGICSVTNITKNGTNTDTSISIGASLIFTYTCDWIWENVDSTHNYKYLEIHPVLILIIWRIVTREGKQVLAWNVPQFYCYSYFMYSPIIE